MPGLFKPTNDKPSEPKKTGGLFNSSKIETVKPKSSGGLFNPTSSQPVQADAVDPYNTKSVDKSISNAQMRIKSAGGEIRADKRNGIEKFLNLPEDQNWLFDSLDVLGRPQQALYSIAQGAINNDPAPLKRGWEGFTGQNRITGSDFARQAGIKNKAAQIGAGLALDIVADPINLIPGGAIVSVGKGLFKGALKGGKTLESALPALKGIRESKVSPVIEAAKEGLGGIFKYQHGWDKTLRGTKDDTLKNLYNQTENDIRYMSENSLRDVTGAAKASGGVKTGDEVGRLMEKDLRQFEDVKGYEFPDGVTRTENKKDLLDEIDIKKSAVQSLGKEVNQTRKTYEAAISQTAKDLDLIDNQIRRTYFATENRYLRKLRALSKVPGNVEQLAKDKAFEELSQNPKFNFLTQKRDSLKTHLDTIRTDSKTVNAGKIADIQKTLNETEDLKTAIKNPVVIQKELQRPVRQYSTDPQVTKAADDLMKSNNTIREWAVDNDIPVGEIDGYMRHILSLEEAALKKQKKPSFTDQTRSGMSNPDKKVLSARTLMGSAEDINERLGRKHTETNAYFSSAVGQQKLIQYGNAVKFRREVLSNPSFAKKHKPGDTLDPSHELINTNNYKFIDNTTHSLPNEIGGDYVVTKGTKAALDRYQKLTSDVGINAFLKSIDTGMSWWKRGALLSLPYHIRNDLGAKFNSYIAGMSLYDLGKYSALATKDVTKALAKGIETPLYNEFRKQGLGSSSQMAVEFAKHGDDPSKAITKIVTDQSKTLGGKTLDALNPLRIFDNSQKLGTFVDQMNRFAMYRWARETKKMSPKDAAKIVTETQFDYTKITKAEKEVFTRMMPFYRWARNNIPFQLRKFAEDPARYTHVNKLRTNAQDSFGLDDSNTSQYMKEQFQIPVTGDGKGKGKALGLNLPIGDLTKIANPLKLGSDMLNPFIKLGVELPNNVNLLKNSKIQKFEGEQKKFKVPDTIFGQKVPFGGKGLGGIDAKIAYAIEQLGGQPVRAASNLFGIPTAQEKENKDIKPSLGIGTLFKDYDVNKTNLTQKKILLKKLMDQIDYLEQENGVRPKSVSDIKKGR